MSRDMVGTILAPEQIIVPAKFTLEMAFASVEPLPRPDDFEQRIHEASGEKAARTGRELREG